MDKLIRIKDLAANLKVPESTIYSWRNRGDIPSECFLKIGGTIFIQIERFNKWVENQA